MEKKKTVEDLKNFVETAEKKASIIDPYQTARDTSSAMGVSYMEELKKVIERHKSLTEPYVIAAYTRRDLPLENCLHTTFVARRSRPIPAWGMDIYEVDNSKGAIYLLVSLPSEADARQITKRPDLFCEKMVADCHRMLTKGGENFKYQKEIVKF